MKRFITMTLVLMLMSIFIACATTPEQRAASYDLKSSVGNSQFVGDSGFDSRGLVRTNIHGY
jgi:hypothetical protein